jgi:plastocyanin
MKRLLLLLPLAACGAESGPSGGGDGPVIAIAKLAPSGDAQTDTVGQLLPLVLQARVTTDGTPTAGIIVTFAGAGVLGQPVDTTDALGVVTTPWTLGTVAGGQQVTASVGGAVGSPLTFNATALPDAPAQLVLVSGNGQEVEMGDPYPAPLVVRVVDQYTNPVSGFLTTWGHTGPAVRAADSITTNNIGVASQAMTAGDSLGNVLVTATATGLTGSPRQFSSTIVPPVTQATVNSNFFQPQHIVITAGSAVRWTWNAGLHSVTPDSAGAFAASGNRNAGFVHGPIVFANPGVYAYHCEVHIGMTGTVTVN